MNCSQHCDGDQLWQSHVFFGFSSDESVPCRRDECPIARLSHGAQYLGSHQIDLSVRHTGFCRTRSPTNFSRGDTHQRRLCITTHQAILTHPPMT